MNLSSLFANKIFEYLLAGDDPALQQQAGRITPLPPPWASAAEAFHRLCNGCGACAQACGSGIISMDEDGFPIVDFKQGGCTFCGDCARSCPTGALQFDPEQKPWTLAARIGSNCLLGSRVLCRTCGEQCPNAAIRFPLAEGQLPQVSPEQCSGCGACVSVCPVGAVSLATCNKGE
ncbi:MAG: ferredoxin-type protein NapF [Candidatus Electronema sp. V4]|uniref:ferredoxin-type protein NapF n=1 Tax=Candidatus Electronema sp. V4 TaxID=3454756 RepID=UPI00405547C4